MALSVVQHRVADYGAWRKAYDDVATLQKEGGVVRESVYQSKDDPNDVLVLHEFGTTAEAEAFFANPDLLAAMKASGVQGAPRVEFYEEATS